MSGNMELEKIDATCWTGENSSINIKSSSYIAVGAMEG